MVRFVGAVRLTKVLMGTERMAGESFDTLTYS